MNSVILNCMLPSGDGPSPVNWLSQIRRNLTIEFLDLNFASRKNYVKTQYSMEI